MPTRFSISRALTLAGAGALLLLAARCGTYAALGSRNVHGATWLEGEQQACRVPGTRAVARLYRGNGGATSAFWYSVTLQRGLLGRERQFLYAYDAPVITGIACSRAGVHVAGLPREGDAAWPGTFAVAEIDTSYVPRPLTFSKGVSRRVFRGQSRGERVYRWVALVAGLGLLAAGVLLARRGLRAPTSRPAV